MVSSSERARLRWACRRGMRELDLLLGAFVDTGFDDLTETDQQRFMRMLDAADQELMEWLLGQATPTDRELARVVEIVRGAYTP